MTFPSDDQVVVQIILDTKQANAKMRELTNNFSSLFNEIGIQSSKIQRTIQGIANVSGRSFSAVGQSLKDMYATQVDNAKISKTLGDNLKGAFNTQVDQSVKNLEGGLKRATKAGDGFNQVMRLVRGTLVAIGVFRVFQFIETSIRKAIDTAKEFEQSLYRLVNVERILSQAGQDITLKGLQEGIEETKKLLPIFSEADITQEVASVALLTKELGFSEKQVTDLSRAIGILNIRSTENESLLETTNKVITSLITGQARGVAALGLSFTETAVKTKALELGLLKAGESLSELTDQEKALAKLQIILETTGNELKNVNDYLDTNVAKIQETQAAWEDLLRTVGEILLPFVANLSPALDALSRGFDNVKISIAGLLAIIGAGITAFKLLVSGSITSIDDLVGKTIEAAILINKELIEKFFPERALENIDTATSGIEGLGEAITELPGLDDLINDLQKLTDKAQEAEEKFQLGLARDLEDFNIGQAREYEDLLRDIANVQEDSNQKVADSNKKYRDKELEAEKKFQEQLRQLREKFLFNLEDALRERDARQVLRLQAQYQMDKQALINENELRKESNDQQHQDDLERIRRERDDRIAELQEEYKIKQQREQEDFELEQARKAEDHQRDMDRIAQEIDDRLMEFARAIGEEYNLNETGVDQLYKLLEQYYGPGGNFEKLYDYSYDTLVSRAQQMLAEVNAIVSQAQALTSYLPVFNPGAISAAPFIGAQADGGTYFANRPTTALFGEAGPEIATFTPLSKLGRTGGLSGVPAGGRDGTVNIELWLSPDLEARVMNNTLDATANVFTRINRSKK